MAQHVSTVPRPGNPRAARMADTSNSRARRARILHAMRTHSTHLRPNNSSSRTRYSNISLFHSSRCMSCNCSRRSLWLAACQPRLPDMATTMWCSDTPTTDQIALKVFNSIQLKFVQCENLEINDKRLTNFTSGATSTLWADAGESTDAVDTFGPAKTWLRRAFVHIDATVRAGETLSTNASKPAGTRFACAAIVARLILALVHWFGVSRHSFHTQFACESILSLDIFRKYVIEIKSSSKLTRPTG